MRKDLLIAIKVVLVMSLLSMAHVGFAQGPVGNITGVVTDNSGAPVSGATVNATNNATGEIRNTVTDDEGIYAIPALNVGNYNISIAAPGFNVSLVKSVQVNNTSTVRISVELQIRNTEEIVVIESMGDGDEPRVVDNGKLIKLPILGRNPNELILLSPGVVRTNSRFEGFAINGSRERNNNFQVDGIDNNDTEVPNGRGAVNLDIDSIQEFRVITNDFNAEFGRNSGAVINFVTKSGTNEFHGGLYEYNRSNTFSARNFFDITGVSDPLHRNQFGGTIGGPIKKDRAFFFFSYQGDRFNIGTAQVRGVPSAEARRGILQDPDLGQIDIKPGSENIINGFMFNMFNPAITQLIDSIYPLGNDPTNAPNPGTFDAFRFIFTERNRQDDLTTRVDYQLSANHRLFGRYSFNRGDFTVGADSFPGFNDATRSLQRKQLFSLNVTSILTPRIINQLRVGLNRLNIPFNGAGDGSVATTLDDKIKEVFRNNGVPLEIQPFGGKNGQLLNISIPNAPISDLFSRDSERRFTGTTTIADTVSYLAGSHSFKAGIETRFSYENSNRNPGRSETIFFSANRPLLIDNDGRTIPSTQPVSGFASFLYGIVSLQTQSQFFNKAGDRVDSNLRGFRVRDIDSFFQDTWQVLPNLTFNYGIRYEFKGVPYEVNGLLSTLIDQDPSGPTPAGGFIFQLVGKNSPNENLQLYDDDLNNFAPRIGFAWDPFKRGKTQIRGGYGLFYDRVFGNLFINTDNNLPFRVDFGQGFSDFTLLQKVMRVQTQGTKFTAVEGDFLVPVLFPVAGKRGNNPFQREFRTPYSQNYNVGIRQELSAGLFLEVDYAGTKGTKLLRVINGNLTSVKRRNALTGTNNQVSANSLQNIFNGSFNTAFFNTALNLTSAFSTYHSLAVRITKRLIGPKYGTGEIQGLYTYSHSIDNAEDPLDPSRGGFLNNFPFDSSGFEGGFNKPERGESGFDIRQRMVINFNYQMPFQFDNKFINNLLGGYAIAGIIQAQSGKPYSIFYPVDTQGTGTFSRARFASGGNGELPSPLVNPRLQTGPSPLKFQSVNSLFDGSSNIINPGQGNVPRSAFVGPGFATVDFSISKRFVIAERHQLLLRADFFNLFNRVNFEQPENVVGPLLGQSLSAFDPRIIQFVLRYNF